MDLKPPAAISADLLRSAEGHLDDCHLCPHHCGADRADASGFCRVGRSSYIASEMLHMGEEALLRPAHAIFLSGCTARCTFCTAAKFAFVPTYGVAVSPQQLAARMALRQREGARSICFIGGDPAPHIPFILSAIAALGERKRVPTVFNSNFYLTDDGLDLLEPAIDIFLPDLKFGPRNGVDGCGQRIGGMPDYWRVVTEAVDRLYCQKERLIVRHLLMPGHFDCCTQPILHWLAGRPGLQLSLLAQYLPPAHARGPLASCLDTRDVARAQVMADDLGLDRVE